MEAEKGIVLDVGVGYGESLIRRARENPNQRFVIIEPEPRNLPKEDLPANLSWIIGKVGKESFLPFKENFADEVNLDFVLVNVYGEQEEKKFAQKAEKILRDAIRVLKPAGKVFFKRAGLYDGNY